MGMHQMLGPSFGSGGDYTITRSLRFNSGDSAYLSRTPSSAGNRRTWSFSAWIKLSDIGTSDRQVFSCRVSGTAQIQIGQSGSALIGFSEYNIFNLRTDRLMRDPGAWFHLVCVYDSTNSTAGDRARIYINGVRETNFSTESYPSYNAEASWNRTEQHNIGSLLPSYTNYFHGYMAEIHFCDGQALAASDFGEYNDDNVWQPKEFDGTYGTNGFYLDFSDNSSSSALGTDSSGNNNTWTVNNFSVAAGSGNDSLFDSPTNGAQSDTGAGGEVSGNYCTFNPVDSNQTHSNGNLHVTSDGPTSPRAGTGTIAVSSGKWYWEVTVSALTIQKGIIGVVEAAYDGNGSTIPNASSNGVFYFGEQGQKIIDNTTTSYGASYTTNDVIGVAFNLDDDEITFYKNGSSQGTITAKTFTGAYKLAVGHGASSGSTSYVLNTGQRAFSYAAPSGFKTLNTASLPTPTVAEGKTYFNAVLYTGTGSNPRAVTGVGHSSDLVWIKARSDAAGHAIMDSVRGTGTNALASHTNGAEGSETYGQMSSFDSDGFTVTFSANGEQNVNFNNRTYVAWSWDAGSSTVSNTDGSITANVRANPSAGFSIVSYSGTGASATVGHGLNAVPEMIIVKNRNNANSWSMYHVALGNTNTIALNSTAAPPGANSAYWNNTTPTNSVYSVGSSDQMNGGYGNTYIGYVFAPIEGYSAFGSYTGNGSTDGPFVHTGFRPAFILYKESSASGEHWHIRDTARDPINVTNKRLMPSTALAEGSGTSFEIDVCSNGFKLRHGNDTQNFNGSTYIYAAFAEHPFKTARAR